MSGTQAASVEYMSDQLFEVLKILADIHVSGTPVND
jgi:hypothetical protein